MGSDPIGPGDWVEVVKMTPTGNKNHSFRMGAVYRVQDVIPDARCACGRRGALRIVEMPHPEPRGAWCVFGFRPVHRPSRSTLIETLKTPAPEREEETAHG